VRKYKGKNINRAETIKLPFPDGLPDYLDGKIGDLHIELRVWERGYKGPFVVILPVSGHLKLTEPARQFIMEMLADKLEEYQKEKRKHKKI